MKNKINLSFVKKVFPSLAVEKIKQERKGFRSMIASSQFSNLQLGNLTTWQFGSSAIWQLDNLATWQEMLKSTLATFNRYNFQLWQLSILATFKKSIKNHLIHFRTHIKEQLPIFTTLVDNPPFSACMDLAIKNLIQIDSMLLLLTLKDHHIMNV